MCLIFYREGTMQLSQIPLYQIYTLETKELFHLWDSESTALTDPQQDQHPALIISTKSLMHEHLLLPCVNNNLTSFSQVDRHGRALALWLDMTFLFPFKLHHFTSSTEPSHSLLFYNTFPIQTLSTVLHTSSRFIG